MTENIILVNEKDVEVGIAEKLKVHQEGLLHRAFSLFVYQGDKLLLQKRQLHKYHSAGLWTNTCCSHPRAGEDITSAVVRRLKEELGISIEIASLIKLDIFHYKAQVGSGLLENEIDHVFVAKMPDNLFNIDYNIEEISEIKWVELKLLQQELKKNPKDYTVWLSQVLEIVEKSGIVV